MKSLVKLIRSWFFARGSWSASKLFNSELNSAELYQIAFIEFIAKLETFRTVFNNSMYFVASMWLERLDNEPNTMIVVFPIFYANIFFTGAIYTRSDPEISVSDIQFEDIFIVCIQWFLKGWF